MATKVSDAELELDVQAYFDAAGNRSEAARDRGIKQQTFSDRLRMAEERLGVKLGKVADGHIKSTEYEQRPLPKKGHIHRYICTSIQNNTLLHPGFNNLVAYSDWLDNLPEASCQILIGTFSYQMAAYGPKAVKQGTYKSSDTTDKLWFDPQAVRYIVDHSVQLAPGIIWCGEQNILPTNKNPLVSMEDYNGRASNIIPQAKIAMESVPSMQDEATKFNYATGTVTQRNYIQKRAGIIAEQSHSYGAMLVEVDDQGNWWVRQLEIGSDDEIMDIGPTGYSGVYIQAGQVTAKHVVASITWADFHAAGMDPKIYELGWGEGGMLDTLRCRWQFMGDVFSMRNRSPHEERDFHRTYEKHADEEDSVKQEVELTTELLDGTIRDWCYAMVVASNHDDHLKRWLNEADFRKDPLNARYFCHLQERLLQSYDEGDRDFNILEYALNASKNIRFLALDEGFVILKEVDDKGIQCSIHGHKGPNGAFGTTANLTKLGRPITKGHDHKATIRGNVHSVGTCAMREPYAKGPSSWSVTHSVTYDNAARALVTMWNGKYRA